MLAGSNIIDGSPARIPTWVLIRRRNRGLLCGFCEELLRSMGRGTLQPAPTESGKGLEIWELLDELFVSGIASQRIQIAVMFEPVSIHQAAAN
jgi:hypothetical protein